MSLENLKSIFKEGFNDQLSDYISNRPVDENDTKLFNQPPQPPNVVVTNPTDFSTAVGNNALPYTPLTQLGESFMDGLSWESLYNKNHSPLDNPEHKGLIPISYPNVNRDNLNILDISADFRTASLSQLNNLLGSASIENIDDFFTSRGVEPYIVSQIGDRETTLGGRGLPINRMVTDAVRLGKYLSSPAGLLFIGKQEALGLQGQKYRKFYNPLSTIISAGFRAGGGPASLLDRTQPNIMDLFKENEYPLFNPNAEPGGQQGAIDAILSISNGESLLESVSQGSPLGVNSLMNDFTGKFLPTNFSNFIQNRFGPFRPGQEGELDKIKDTTASFFGGNDVFNNRKKSEPELEVAEKYPNFNPSEENVSPLQSRNYSVEVDNNTIFGPLAGNEQETSQEYPNFNSSEENVSPLSLLGKELENNENFGRFESTTNSPNVTSSLGPFNDNETEFPSADLKELGNTFRTNDETSNSGFGVDKHSLLQFGI